MGCGDDDDGSFICSDGHLSGRAPAPLLANPTIGAQGWCGATDHAIFCTNNSSAEKLAILTSTLHTAYALCWLADCVQRTRVFSWMISSWREMTCRWTDPTVSQPSCTAARVAKPDSRRLYNTH